MIIYRACSITISMKTINDILQITKYFWEACNTSLDAIQASWKKEIHYDEYLDIIATKKPAVFSIPE
ncbi:uncharacterized protein BX663DRAFT_501132 [Cokeromyces recurvatus]|uniref:uncharacterized protein n=1 Tax=Cokeromyces recurvatus TaxID=90255 RepID=UPI00221EE361|nr:uncharacterized protein BX663DRAFT_501132 [Cokeromyces recurvatus]KAI7904951.1 hypothetical protein BX663DRAFT_501132 [Cokeromyces recurvatus]